MAEIRTLFWDLGGVVLSDGWNLAQRQAVLARFGINGEAFEERHEMLVAAWETGAVTLDEYLDQTIFYEPRPFTREDFKQAIFAQQRANTNTLALAKQFAGTRKYLMATLNNESRELNLHRIDTFGLRRIFDVFFSSGFLGVMKPDHAIYRLALEMTQKPPEACCFIDDRPLNLECARKLGMHTIHYTAVEQLVPALAELGVRAA